MEEAEKTAGRFRDESLSAQALQLDVGQPGSVDAVFDQIAFRWSLDGTVVADGPLGGPGSAEDESHFPA